MRYHPSPSSIRPADAFRRLMVFCAFCITPLVLAGSDVPAAHDLARHLPSGSGMAWLALLGALIVLAVALRRARDWVRARLERMRVEERVRERRRIAGTLHDTLLQSAQCFLFSAQAAADLMSADDPARPLLEQSLRRAEAVAKEARDRIRNLRSVERVSADLPALLTVVGRDLAGDRPDRFLCKVEGVARGLRYCVADEIFLVMREALVNAFRHGGAGVVELSIRHGEKHLTVAVRDNGCGIEPDVLRQGQLPGHWGLRGMLDGAERIPARLELSSRIGCGTEIRLRVDAQDAYRPESLSHRRPMDWNRAHGGIWQA